MQSSAVWTVDQAPLTDKRRLDWPATWPEESVRCTVLPSEIQWLTPAGNVVLLTGAVDYLSDGERVIAVENGHEFLGQVTGVRPILSRFFNLLLTRRTDWLRCWNGIRLLPGCTPIRQAPVCSVRYPDV
jgi:hypothetical protein